MEKKVAVYNVPKPWKRTSKLSDLLRRFTDQPLGFFSTAECFVFVSAFLAGMIFRKRAEKLGPDCSLAR